MTSSPQDVGTNTSEVGERKRGYEEIDGACSGRGGGIRLQFPRMKERERERAGADVTSLTFPPTRPTFDAGGALDRDAQ